MESNRTLITKQKPRMVLNKSFKVFNKLNAGDSVQLLINGVVEGEHLDFYEDGMDLISKVIRINSAEKITAKNARDTD